MLRVMHLLGRGRLTKDILVEPRLTRPFMQGVEAVALEVWVVMEHRVLEEMAGPEFLQILLALA